MTVGDVERARRCCERAVYDAALRHNKTVKPANTVIESMTFPVPEGFDYNAFLAAVNKELHQTDLHASACRRTPAVAERVLRITDM